MSASWFRRRTKHSNVYQVWSLLSVAVDIDGVIRALFWSSIVMHMFYSRDHFSVHRFVLFTRAMFTKREHFFLNREFEN